MYSQPSVDDCLTDQLRHASHRNNANCVNCQAFNFCYPNGNETTEAFSSTLLEIKKGQTIYDTNSECQYIFSVIKGCVKTLGLTNNGCEQVMGFYFTGEVFGFDGITNGSHSLTATALEDSVVCKVPLQFFLKTPNNANKLIALMSNEHDLNQQHLAVINKTAATVRIAALLLDIATRLCQGKLSDLSFNLVLTRADIASYTGLTVETVSRLMAQMQRDGLYKSHKQQLEIRKLEELQKLAYF
jgi:CRP/FNR family transcriptional regulator